MSATRVIRRVLAKLRLARCVRNSVCTANRGAWLDMTRSSGLERSADAEVDLLPEEDDNALMDWTVALAALKLGAILLTGISGISALLVDFRDRQTNQITHWGRRALVVTIASTLVAAGIQGLETYQSKVAERNASDRNESLLRNIQRGVYPLDPLRAGYSFEVHLSTLGLERYGNELAESLAKASAKVRPGNTGTRPQILWSQLADAGKPPVPFGLLFKPPTTRIPTDNKVVQQIVKRSELSLRFYAKPRKASDITWDSEPDWHGEVRGGDPEMLFDARQRILRFRFDMANAEHNKALSKGKIASVRDLSGATMLFGLNFADEEPELLYPGITNAVVLNFLEFETPAKRYFLSNNNVRGTSIFKYSLPEDILGTSVNLPGGVQAGR